MNLVPKCEDVVTKRSQYAQYTLGRYALVFPIRSIFTPCGPYKKHSTCQKCGRGHWKYERPFLNKEFHMHIPDIWENVLPQFTKVCIETPCWCPFEGHQYGGRKPTETSIFEFSYKSVNTSLSELIKIKVISVLRQGMFRPQNLAKSVTF